MNRKPLKAALFDMDGLLLDTEKIYTQATQEILTPLGHEFDWALKQNMIGKNSRIALEYLIHTLNLPYTVDQFKEKQTPLFQQYFPLAEPMPFAQELTERFQKQGFLTAVATSSAMPLVKIKTSRHQAWFAKFGTIVAGDQVPHCKPAPDLFLEAARRLGVQPEECLVFEDAPSGVEAAKRAGMQVVAVPDPNMNRAFYAQADVVLESLAQFQPERFGFSWRD